jgi:hypothetical protein
LEIAGNIYADKYYSLINGGGSQNATPMVYGTYDVWFDLANERVALMTPGKDYAQAIDGGDPVVVIAGLTDHTWGMIGSFAASNSWTTEVDMAIEGDYAVAKNVTLANGNEFKFRADDAWTLSYGAGCDVNVGEVYTTYNNGGNMKFVGEDGAYDIYFSMVDAKFYMEKYVEAPAADTFDKIDNVADLTAGTYYLSGYATKGSNVTFTAPYHVCTGTGADLFTQPYNYNNDKTLVEETESQYAPSEVVLVAVDGKANTYYIMFGDKYLYSTQGENRKLGTTTTATEWVAKDNAKGGITLKTTVGSTDIHLGTGTADSKLLRSYKSEATLQYGCIFFKKN